MQRRHIRDRFAGPLSPEATAFTSSVEEDASLLPFDILGSLAHARMLEAVGLLPKREGKRLRSALVRLKREAEAGTFTLDPSLEDVHMNVEVEITRRIGEAGARLPTGRSRNDQVATDLMLFLRHSLTGLEERALAAALALLEQAGSPQGRLVVPSATHMQDAQHVYLAQILQVHSRRLLRDSQRLRSIREALVLSPLGAGAVAGSSLPLDRALTARLLGFQRPNPNSMDAISDRDPEMETLSALAILAVHVSSLAGEWVLYSTPQFDRLRMDERFVTTSSLMPHKRNPDVAELLRAETAVMIGLLTADLSLQKGLPLSYNRDLQAGKRLLIEGIRRAGAILDVVGPMVATSSFRAAGDLRVRSPTASVEVADSLVRAGVPFREAHSRVARFIAGLDAGGRKWGEVVDEDWYAAFPELKETSGPPPSISAEPDLRTTEGGSSYSQVAKDRKQQWRELQSRTRALARERTGWGRMVGLLEGR